jgi:Tol biopolymer transport system component
VVENDSIDIWVYEWERDTMTRLTFGSDAWFPVWSPDGKHIAFMSAQDGGASNLYYMRADGAGKAVRLTQSRKRQIPYSFSSDGKRLAFFEFNPETQADIWTLPLEEAKSDHPKVGMPEPFLVTTSDERAPMISPDGSWLAYESNTGTYHMNSDCTGTAQIDFPPPPGATSGAIINLIMVLSDHGRTIHTVVTSLTPPGVPGPVPVVIHSDGSKLGSVPEERN